MTSNQLMTAGAVAFAGFALFYITRTPGGAVAAQPGQAARDSGLQSWLGASTRAYDQMTTADYWKHLPSSTGAVLLPGMSPFGF